MGIVRNNKFIPWDNDIDLVMLRKDYQKFIKYAKKELQYPYFLQTGYNEKGYYSGLLKIRKSDTTAILYSQFPVKKINQGLFIDIFPLDGVPESQFVRKLQLKMLFWIKCILKFKERKAFIGIPKSKSYRIMLIVLAPLIFLLPQSFFYFIFDSIGRMGNRKNAEYVDKLLYRGYNHLKQPKFMPKECYMNAQTVPFEDTEISVPSAPEKILVQLYGKDFMIPRQEAPDHGDVFFDLETSYEHYLNSGVLQ
ncbi:MAG: LicD family protein [Treponema sp.]|nr:LicD family protein [Treponema sp.]